jgi:inhibitor of cysteine peptidase
MKFINVVFAIFVAAMISCTGPYTINDSGSTINLGIDDPFDVQLSGNASTGYTWEIISYDSTVVKQLGEVKFIPDDDRIGSGGNYLYSFQTVAAGQTDLVMVYKRRWDEHKLHDKTFRLKVVVGTMGRILEE